MTRTAAIATLVLALTAGSAVADTYEGVEAFRQGRFEDAITALRPVAKAGDAEAQYYLARMYAAGLGGLAKDPTRAAHLLAQAAESGYAAAQHEYGIALSIGDGVKKDLLEALKWFLLASQGGVADAKLYADEIGRRMSRMMVVEARKAARSWQEARETRPVPEAKPVP